MNNINKTRIILIGALLLLAGLNPGRSENPIRPEVDR